MTKQEEAKEILRQLGVPEKQQAKICQLTLLALAGITPDSSWIDTTNDWMRIHDIIRYSNIQFGEQYAENSRETFRKQALHHFRNAAFIEDNGVATNSPNFRYRLTNEMVELLKLYGTEQWISSRKAFTNGHTSLINMYSSKKKMSKIGFCINGINLDFSPGSHNLLQKAVLEEFLPRFAPGSICLYVGDTAKKNLIREDAIIESIGINLGNHEKLPDILLYNEEKNWVYFIECVTSVGPMSPKRFKEINEMIEHWASFGRIYVTAFPNSNIFKKFISELAWETEVWLSDEPDHMIHLNGDKFIGPRN